MTWYIERQAGVIVSMFVTCDTPGCTCTPTEQEIVAGGGLRNMGWQANGGTHLCPTHNPEEKEPCLSLPLQLPAQRS